MNHDDLISPKCERLHADLKTWLFRNHPHAEPTTVLGALLFEIGEIAARESVPMTRPEVSAFVRAVGQVMEYQIALRLQASGKVRS